MSTTSLVLIGAVAMGTADATGTAPAMGVATWTLCVMIGLVARNSSSRLVWATMQPITQCHVASARQSTIFAMVRNDLWKIARMSKTQRTAWQSKPW